MHVNALRAFYRRVTRDMHVGKNNIQHKISAAYHRSATVDSFSIRIETSGSKVILRGKVRFLGRKKEAENIVWSSPGNV